MKTATRKQNTVLSLINKTLIDLPSPSNINYWWNLGSLLGLSLSFQLISGLILAIHYTPNTEESFNTVSHMMRDVNMMWMWRIMHSNGASLFFFLIYIHIARGLYFSSFTKKMMWTSGTIILLCSMATAFMGYVLPWGQMSFWAATVITNLLSALPFIGKNVVEWIWGGFSVANPTLTRFFTIHFLLPFLIAMLVVLHITILHAEGSSNPLGTTNNIDKLSFHPMFSSKDLMGLLLTTTIFMFLTMKWPFVLSDPENFNMANPLVTPVHIQPEWYFLFAYAILRSIPNKLGGVVAMIMAILSPLILMVKKIVTKNISSNLFSKSFTWIFFSIFLLLSWLGSQPVEQPYDMMSQTLTSAYFCTIFLMSIFSN